MSGPARRDGLDWVFEVRVQPRASRSEFAGLFGDRLRIRLEAPPVDGRANAALVEFLASACAVPRAQVSIEHGHTGRDKRVRVRGLRDLPPALHAIVSPRL